MTKLVAGKPVVRETAEFRYASPFVVELHPKYLEFRLKGTSEAFRVTIAELVRRFADNAHAVEARPPRKVVARRKAAAQ